MKFKFLALSTLCVVKHIAAVQMVQPEGHSFVEKKKKWTFGGAWDSAKKLANTAAAAHNTYNA